MRNRFLLLVQALLWGLVALTAVYFLFTLANGQNPLGNFDVELNPEADVVLFEQTINDDIDNLRIEWVSGGVTILPSADDSIHIIERSTSKLAQSKWASIKQDNKSLTIVSRNKTGIFFLFWHTPITHLEVRLPEDLYESMVLEGTSGSYHINDLDFTKLSVELTSGEFDLDRSDIQDFELSMQSGLSDLDNVNTQSATVYSTSGSFRFMGSITESLKAEMTSGEQVYRLSGQAPSTLDFEMTSGSASIDLPENPGFELGLEKTSGSFQADFEHTEFGDVYTYGDGSYRYTADMTSGSLRISVQ